MGLFDVDIKKKLDDDERNLIFALLEYLNTHSEGPDADRAGELQDMISQKRSMSRTELAETADLMYKAGEHLMISMAKIGEMIESSFAGTVMDLIGKIKKL